MTQEGHRMETTRHIGIVGVSPEGAALFIQRLSRLAGSHEGPTIRPRVTMHNEPLAHYIDAIQADDWHRVGDLLKQSAAILASCGAEICLSPDNAVQYAIQLAEHESEIPWLSMPELVADALSNENRTTVGILGTQWVTQGSAFQTMLGMRGIKVVSPDADDAERLNQIILDDLINGRVREGSRDEVASMACRFRDRGCESLIIGSSEVPMVLDTENSPLPLYDSAEILAQRALHG